MVCGGKTQLGDPSPTPATGEKVSESVGKDCEVQAMTMGTERVNHHLFQVISELVPSQPSHQPNAHLLCFVD